MNTLAMIRESCGYDLSILALGHQSNKQPIPCITMRPSPPLIFIADAPDDGWEASLRVADMTEHEEIGKDRSRSPPSPLMQAQIEETSYTKGAQLASQLHGSCEKTKVLAVVVTSFPVGSSDNHRATTGRSVA